MGSRNKYKLIFQKLYREDTGMSYSVEALEGGSADLATYLTASNYEETLADIDSVPDDKDVKIGDTLLSNEDFKAILKDWLEHIQPLSVENEIVKLRKYLMLPITNVVFDDRSQLGVPYVDENHDHMNLLARLYIQDEYIGDFPYKSTVFGLAYNMVNGLIDWPKVARIYYDELFAEILMRESLAVSFVASTYEMLLVKDASGKFIAQAFCKYQDGRWRVGVSGLDGKVQSKTVTVKLTPPKIDL